MNISLSSYFHTRHYDPSFHGSLVIVDKLKAKGNAHTAPMLQIHLNKSSLFYVFHIMHCDIIMQYKPTKCTFFKIILPQETHTSTNTGENNPLLQLIFDPHITLLLSILLHSTTS